MNSSPFPDLYSLLRTQAQLRGADIALESGVDGSSLSYEMLFREVSRMMQVLIERGLSAGMENSRVAIVMPNGLEMSLALLTASCAGVAVPFNPAFQESEFHAYFKETGVSSIWLRQDDVGPARKVAIDMGLQILEWPLVGGLVDSTPGSVAIRPPAPHDVALILLTSGSTGRGKKVPLTHRNLCTSAWDVCRSISLTENDRCLCMWEQFHIGGLVDLLLAPLASGGRVMLAGSFDVVRFFDCLGRFAPTWFQGVPTTLRETCYFAGTRGIDVRGSSLRLIRSVAAALPPEWMREIENRFDVPVIQTFGMTEASPLITSTGLLPAERKPGSTGKPCGPEVEIMDDESHPLPRLAHGRIAVRGPNIFAGYEGDDEANEASFHDGWFYTGDTGYFDADGFLFLTGRVKELINRGGEKISPHEIDEILLAHPDIAQAAAFGFPHPTLGEDVGAAVVLKAGVLPDASSIRDHVSKELAAFKVPRKIIFLNDLPRTSVGKIRREAVAEIALEQPASAPYQAPRTALEQCLATIWATELDVPQVGIDDDFAELGGDSLTSVRLIAATQHLLGIAIPDQVACHLGSVREMALFLSQTKPVGDLSDRKSANIEFPDISPQEIRKVLARMGSGNPAINFDPVAAAMKMRNCQSTNEARLFRQNHLSWLTPGELLALFNPQIRTSRLWNAREMLNPFRTLRLAVNRRKWAREIMEELSGMPDALCWKSSALCDHAVLFSNDPLAERSSKTLIVGFSSIGHRLFMPTFRFLGLLDPGTYDLLLLSDPHRCHFEKGIPGIASDMNGLPEVLDQFKCRKGYPDVVAMGTSSGGLPAILTALHNQWRKGIAIGADKPADHPVLNAMLDRLTSGTDSPPNTEVVLAYAQQNARDLAAADDISGRFPKARRLPESRFTQHNIMEELHKRSELQSFLARVLGHG